MSAARPAAGTGNKTAAAVAAGVRVDAEQLIGLRHESRSIPLAALRVRAAQGGQIRSPFRGRGMEFEESRRYEAGDDVRNLDWRVTARTGDLHTKLFREERERPVLLWVDLRAPMFFATEGVFKAVQAARLASVLAWSAVGHGDRIGGIVFSASVHREIRPRRGHGAALAVVHELVKHSAWDAGADQANEGAAEAALYRLRRLARPGSLLLLISDFRDLGASGQANFASLAAHNDVVAINIADRMERLLPPADLYRLSDGRNDLYLDTGERKLRAAWAASFDARRQSLESLCRSHGIFLLDCHTCDDAGSVLRDALAMRKGAQRRAAG